MRKGIGTFGFTNVEKRSVISPFSTVPLAFLGRHAAGSAAIAVELALALCKKGYDIPDEAILEGLAAVENRSRW